MAVISKEDAQQWLSDEKLEVTVLDDDLAATSQNYVFAALTTKYSTSAWSSPSNTPRLIRTIVSLYYSGSLWNSRMQKAAEGEGYGDKLLGRAQMMLEGLVAGEFDLLDPSGTLVEPTAVEGPDFRPNDSSTQLALTDPQHEDATPLKIAMNQVF